MKKGMNGMHVMDNLDRKKKDAEVIQEEKFGSEGIGGLGYEKGCEKEHPKGVRKPQNTSNIPSLAPDTGIPETYVDYTDSAVQLLEGVKKNRELRHSQVPPLRFCEHTLEGVPLYLPSSVESTRNQIWELWYDQGLSQKKISELLRISAATIARHIQVCKRRFDEWITEYGLSVYGNPAQRLDDLLLEYREMLNQVEKELSDPDQYEMSHKDILSHRKLKLELLDRIAKYQAIEPPKQVDLIMHSPAEITRSKMTELFPEEVLGSEVLEIEGEVEVEVEGEE